MEKWKHIENKSKLGLYHRKEKLGMELFYDVSKRGKLFFKAEQVHLNSIGGINMGQIIAWCGDEKIIELYMVECKTYDDPFCKVLQQGCQRSC